MEAVRSVTLMCILITTSVTCNDIQYRTLPGLADKKCSSADIVLTEHTDSVILCLLLCDTSPECKSVFYGTIAGICVGCSEVYNTQTTGLDVENSTIYYRDDIIIGSTCTENSDCTMSNSRCYSSSCGCEPYFSINASGDGCEDFNECQNPNSNNCHTLATCSNTAGGFECTCNTGYEGDGTVCTDVNECITINNCDPAADCTNNPGSYYCTCGSGYSGDGFTCADVNECLAFNDCDPLAYCTNNPGSYLCTCSTGYSGNGFDCTDIDECSTINNCDQAADCTNNPGSYSCTCGTGYSGDGFTCSSYAYGQSCSVNADCTDDETECWSGKCECTPGYHFNPATGTCIATCSSYGDDFTKYTGMDLSCQGSYIGGSPTLEYCKQQCRSLPNCLSMSYHNGIPACQTRTCDPQTNPNNWGSLAPVDTYVRHCD